MAPYEALYGYKCQTFIGWIELVNHTLLGLDLVIEAEQTVRMIRDRLKIAFDRHKSYADMKHRDIKYVVGDEVFLKVSPWRTILRFGRKGKLSPLFIRPYRIIHRVRPVAYQLELPPELARIHDVFHVFVLIRYGPDLSHVLDVGKVELRSNLRFEEELVEILERDEKVLRRTVKMFKILWCNRGHDESTVETEETMKAQYPYLFPPCKF
ncbi:uncharacterized protein LOC120199216 [Hibiscus syriacus]|uniref:uncharacterized protein LOC120199216 n=1 Tax=Hibiscus syriacus TaxID=106335 RepID=UPI0019237C32|nr:uncharacterized protein LOC120199216 [Hibiscus syriacus]